jgi:hypothetical protein
VIYAYTMGYLGSMTTTNTFGVALQIQSVAQNPSDSNEIWFYLKNIGKDSVDLTDPNVKIYVNGQLLGTSSYVIDPSNAMLTEGQTELVTISSGFTDGVTNSFKLVAPGGAFAETTFKPATSTQYSVVIQTDGTTGSSTNPTGSHTYNNGLTLPISATTGSGYVFSSWSATSGITIADPSLASTTATIKAAGTITANFVPLGSLLISIDSFTITAPTESVGGTVSPDEAFTVTAQMKLSSGSSAVTETITPPSGYTVSTNPPSQTVGTADVAFEWTVTAPSSASASTPITLSATATGYTTATASLDVATVSTTSLASGSQITVDPVPVNVGDQTTVVMTVQNSGAATVDSVTPSLILSGDGSAILIDGPTPPSYSISAGDNQEFYWTYQATAAGTITFFGSASGIDISGSEVWTGPLGPSTPVTVN